MMITENPTRTVTMQSWADAVQDATIATDAQEWINAATAKTIAAAFMAPTPRRWNMVAVAHGTPFDTDGLRDEIDNEIAAQSRFPRDDEITITLDALRDWCNALEA